MRLSKFWLLFLLVVPFYLTWTFDHSLWNPDETRDAGIAAEMARDGDYVVPKLNGEAFLEKPPLYYWSTAVIYKLTGRITAGTTRLPSALYGMLGVLLTFLIGQLLFSDRVGLFAAAILATSAQYFRMSHFALMDVALAALVTGAMYSYLKGSRVGFALFTILAFFAKGFLGVILSGIVVTLDLVIDKKPKELAKTIAISALLFFALALPWFWGLWHEGGMRFLEIFIIDNHWKRFVSKTADHTEQFWFFYFLSFPGDFLPWTLLYLGHLRDLFKKPAKYWMSKPRRFLLTWFFGLLLFFCLSSSKRSIYLLPLFPAAALLAAAYLDEILALTELKWEHKTIVYGTGGLCVLLSIALPVAGLYASKNILLFIATLAPVAFLLGLLAKKIREKSFDKTAFVLFGLLAFSVGGASFTLAKPLDEDKSFVPICEEIKKDLGDGVLIGYQMSEMERGVFSFYLNGTIPNPNDPAELAKLLDATRPRSFLLLTNRNKIKEITPVMTDRAEVIYEHRPQKKTRSYLLYRSKN